MDQRPRPQSGEPPVPSRCRSRPRAIRRGSSSWTFRRTRTAPVGDARPALRRSASPTIAPSVPRVPDTGKAISGKGCVVSTLAVNLLLAQTRQKGPRSPGARAQAPSVKALHRPLSPAACAGRCRGSVLESGAAGFSTTSRMNQDPQAPLSGQPNEYLFGSLGVSRRGGWPKPVPVHEGPSSTTLARPFRSSVRRGQEGCRCRCMRWPTTRSSPERATSRRLNLSPTRPKAQSCSSTPVTTTPSPTAHYRHTIQRPRSC
jgi:hypothetical protein